MFREQELRIPVAALSQALLQRLHEHAFLKQLLLEPQRQRLAKRGKASRRKRKIRFEQPFELEKGLVVESDMVELVRAQPRVFEAKSDRIAGEAGVVLFPREALLLRRRNDVAVDHEGGCGIVIEG